MPSFRKKDSIVWILFIWFMLSGSWILFTDSITLAGNKTSALLISLFALSINVALSVAIFWNAFSLTKYLCTRFSSKIAILLSLPLFALADLFTAWVTAFVWMGPQGSFDNVQPLSSPALLLINTPLSYASRLVGFYGLAAFFWLFVFLISQKPKRRLAIPVFVLLCILSLAGWVTFRNVTGGTYEATLVSESLTDRVPSIESPNSKIVVYPEYGFDEITDKNLNERIYRDKQKAYFVASKQIVVDRGHRNVMLLGNATDGITETQDKHRLIPGGEDFSFIPRLLLILAGRQNTLSYFDYSRQVIKGKDALTPFKTSVGTNIGAAVCSSIISPEDYRSLTRQGATILTNSASLDIFEGSRVFAFQQKSLAKFMAISNSRYFLQSANSASAYALDNNGKQIAETKDISTINVNVRDNTRKTPYTYLGEYLAVIGAFVSMYLFIDRKRTRKQS